MPWGDFDTSDICLWWWLLDLVISESLKSMGCFFLLGPSRSLQGQLFPSYAGVSSQTWVMVLLLRGRRQQRRQLLENAFRAILMTQCSREQEVPRGPQKRGHGPTAEPPSQVRDAG